jgi:hypothetical protein
MVSNNIPNKPHGCKLGENRRRKMCNKKKVQKITATVVMRMRVELSVGPRLVEYSWSGSVNRPGAE